MIFSRTVEYAVRAMTFLASQPAGKLTGARAISDAENIPMPFLWKVLQKLARHKLVRSFKGSRGGYQLARSADAITLNAILNAVDGEHPDGVCVLGLSKCDEDLPCPLHGQWREIRVRVANMLEETTVGDLARIAGSGSGLHKIDLMPARSKMSKAAPKGTR